MRIIVPRKPTRNGGPVRAGVALAMTVSERKVSYLVRGTFGRLGFSRSVIRWSPAALGPSVDQAAPCEWRRVAITPFRGDRSKAATNASVSMRTMAAPDATLA